jgi:hypothetical protein
VKLPECASRSQPADLRPIRWTPRGAHIATAWRATEVRDFIARCRRTIPRCSTHANETWAMALKQ